ncbi:MAG TPA: hypothetical protein VGL75_12630 [Acidothermaceae bacterium]|jgi:hypothetical protein
MPPAPILEIYLVWHPEDVLGEWAAKALIAHFHGSAYAGLAGGAVEVYSRTVGWIGPGRPPRPLPVLHALPGGLEPAQLTVVVPVLGTGLARAVRDEPDWATFVGAISEAELTNAPGIAIFTLRDPFGDTSGPLTSLFKGQSLAPESAREPEVLCRELAQGIAQRFRALDGRADARITVFISHTKHNSVDEHVGAELFRAVREQILATRLSSFFDASDIQTGDWWEERLDEKAAESALLMIRTDKYSSRAWTQREVQIAKLHDVPIVVLSALRGGEDRGSFLMDHLPVVPCPVGSEQRAIDQAINRLVDEVLKRAIWSAQTVYLHQQGFDWLPCHAPEPVTVAPWLIEHRRAEADDPHVWILHPDPPLGPSENAAVVELCAIAGFTDHVDILTPRTFAARGGRLKP